MFITSQGGPSRHPQILRGLGVGSSEVDVAQPVVPQRVVGTGRRHKVGIGRVQVHRRSQTWCEGVPDKGISPVKLGLMTWFIADFYSWYMYVCIDLG